MTARRALVAVAVVGWVSVGYLMGRARPVDRARDWTIDRIRFKASLNTHRNAAMSAVALAVVMVTDARAHKDIWLNILTFGRHELPEPKPIVPTSVRPVRVLTGEERVAEVRRRQQEAAGPVEVVAHEGDDPEVVREIEQFFREREEGR